MSTLPRFAQLCLLLSLTSLPAAAEDAATAKTAESKTAAESKSAPEAKTQAPDGSKPELKWNGKSINHMNPCGIGEEKLAKLEKTYMPVVKKVAHEWHNRFMNKVCNKDFAPGNRRLDVEYARKLANKFVTPKYLLGLKPPSDWKRYSEEIVVRCWEPQRKRDYCTDEARLVMRKCVEGLIPGWIPGLLPFVMPLCPKAKELVDDALANTPKWMAKLKWYQGEIDAEIDRYAKFKAKQEAEKTAEKEP